jgi:hypothetical protein
MNLQNLQNLGNHLRFMTNLDRLQDTVAQLRSIHQQMAQSSDPNMRPLSEKVFDITLTLMKVRETL